MPIIRFFVAYFYCITHPVYVIWHVHLCLSSVHCDNFFCSFYWLQNHCKRAREKKNQNFHWSESDMIEQSIINHPAVMMIYLAFDRDANKLCGWFIIILRWVCRLIGSTTIDRTSASLHKAHRFAQYVFTVSHIFSYLYETLFARANTGGMRYTHIYI